MCLSAGRGLPISLAATCLITLGLWDNFLGTPFVQASTAVARARVTTSALWHGGLPGLGIRRLGPPVTSNRTASPTTSSSMSYLFQVHGLLDADGGIHLDYPSSAQNTLNETALNDGPLSPAAAHALPTWYALRQPARAEPRWTPASRFCNGARFDPAAPPASMTRVQALSTDASIDWDAIRRREPRAT